MEHETMKPNQTWITIAHVPDFYNRYPGELLTLSTCLQRSDDATEIWPDQASLWVSIPAELELIDFHSSDEAFENFAVVRNLAGIEFVVWQLSDFSNCGARLEFSLRTRVLKPEMDTPICSEAVLRNSNGDEIVAEALRVHLRLQGEYLNYLPEIYRQDDMMARFLMLFESFWKPVDRQIRQVSNYFDPDLAPEQFLPWLASWVGAYWDEIIPETRRRQMLRMAVSLYQRRGTRGALQDFLTTFSDGQVNIIEHPAHNLVLDSKTVLGNKTALGLNNRPDTFTVEMGISKDRFMLQNQMDTGRMQEMMSKKILSIIDAQKPAHTTCKLNLQIMETHG